MGYRRTGELHGLGTGEPNSMGLLFGSVVHYWTRFRQRPDLDLEQCKRGRGSRES